MNTYWFASNHANLDQRKRRKKMIETLTKSTKSLRMWLSLTAGSELGKIINTWFAGRT